MSNFKKIEEEFIEANTHWEIEKLYVDLALAKGKALTPVEKKFLRGLLCGFSPAEIASKVYESRSSSTVRVYLSNGLYKYIEDLVSNQAGYSVKVKNWSRVTYLLEKAGYKKKLLAVDLDSDRILTTKLNDTNLSTPKQDSHLDLDEAADVSFFYGRETELALIKKYILQDNCRLLVLWGMAGIGKTALARKLAQEIQENFDYVIWRSLHLAPPLETILSQVIQFLSPQKQINITEKSVNLVSSQLIHCLRYYRCLIILDHVDTILDNKYGNELDHFNISDNNYRRQNNYYSLPYIGYLYGYENYGDLIRRIGDSQHQSCLLLTTREKPSKIADFKDENLSVRCLQLTGLNQVENAELFTNKELIEFNQEDIKHINNWYAGNPLFIKLVTNIIHEFFGASVQKFLAQNTLIFAEIRVILDEQFNRLSNLEKQIMYCIAVNPDFISLQTIESNILPSLPQQLILQGIELLQKRSLIERQVSGFSLIPVLREYIIERLIEDNWRFSAQKAGSLLITHAFLEKQLKNYIQASRLNMEN
ncbi:NB-ARC domain-containing protein [Chlorogloeopsis sp. ULAP01]|uniref:NB-ARC domain-containing protein n=1 Tax=Chlorogloeopsis sp. ULAP01 TaxID=3056483 RepID=UPI0025AAF4AB|nr:NB-ARC domain-containing protein [Chlorogloeopsis sp. ULAP01]MDM9385252.1 NB-ARC domain-containing protein [Chlorogloeopsis sp. ULAP01]